MWVEKTCQQGTEAHLDFLFPSEIFYLPVRATRDFLVLDIEVLFEALEFGGAPVYGSEAPAKVAHPVFVTAAIAPTVASTAIAITITVVTLCK